jgi:tRNA (cmo5U34)-methyltransferase
MVKKKVDQGIKASNANWKFSGTVAKKFDKHITKSVPFYLEGHDLVCKISDFFLADKSVCCEIGCSTGTLISKLVKHNGEKKIDYIGIEIEKDMIKESSKKLSKKVKLIQNDFLKIRIKNKCDLIISYYTAQFIQPKNRQDFFNKVFKTLNWGGGFIFFEKVRAPDARFQDMMTSVYEDFKLDNKFSPQEIISKKRSLKGVLEPFSTKGNLDMIKRAGFKDAMTIFKFTSFEGFLAIK